MSDEATGYADREAIHPRAFAVRHLIIQEVKFRRPAADPALRMRLDRVARGAYVEYDRDTHELVVRQDGVEVRRLAFADVQLYSRGDGGAADQRVGTDVHHWDDALEQNRALVRQLVDDMLGRTPDSAA